MLRVHLTFSAIRSFSSRAFRKVAEDQQEKVAKVAIIGMPNSGKSTFINGIMNERICATSDKVHTTTTHAKAIMNRENSQIIAFDTPGLVTQSEIKKHRLTPEFISACRHSIQNASLIGVVHDAANRYTRHQIHPMILELLEEFEKKPSFLVLNKVDRIKSKRILLDLASRLTCDNISLEKIHTKVSKMSDGEVDESEKQDRPRKKRDGWPNFKSVFMVSALNGDGVEDVLNFIESQAQEAPWEFRKNEITDQTPTMVIQEFVRARLLDYLPQEIPYLLNSELEYFDNSSNKIFASVIVTCPTERIERLVCGSGDGKLRQITDRITSDLIQHFKCPVKLTVNTVVIKPSESKK